MKKFFEMQHNPDLKKKVKHLLLKVIQDYHPDKVKVVVDVVILMLFS